MMTKISRLRLFGFLIFHIQGAGMQVLLYHWEILVKELLFDKISVVQHVNAIEMKFLAKIFKGFWIFFRSS